LDLSAQAIEDNIGIDAVCRVLLQRQRSGQKLVDQFEVIPPGQVKDRIANATQDVPLDPATQQRSIRFMSESLTEN
jgi:hypothetical protein